jgi:hypothetical protein
VANGTHGFPFLSFFSRDLQAKRGSAPPATGLLGCIIRCFDVPRLHVDDSRTFLGGLATVAYKVCTFGLLISFMIMFFYYNEDVQQAIVPQDEGLIGSVIADIEVEIRFLGYTGRCPKQLNANESYIDRLENIGSTHRYTAGDVSIEDAGWFGRREPDPKETTTTTANVTTAAFDPNATETTTAPTMANMSLRGTPAPAPAWSPGLSFVQKEASWQEKYMKRSTHVVACETGYLPFDPYAFDAIENATNSTSRRLAKKGGATQSRPTSSSLGAGTDYSGLYGDDGDRIGYSINGSNITGPMSDPDHGPVLMVKWTCEACTLDRIGALAISINGVDDQYAVSASAIKYKVIVTPVIPAEDNSVQGIITPLEKTKVFRGSTATRQKVTFMPATYTCDAANVFGRTSYRVQFSTTEVGDTISREEFVDYTNVLRFVVDFGVGSFQFNTRVTPKMTFLNALCELGGLFGAVAAMYIGWMVFVEKHEKFVPKRVLDAMEHFGEKGDPYREKVEDTTDDDPVTMADLHSKVESTHIIMNDDLDLSMDAAATDAAAIRPGAGIEVGVRVKVLGTTTPGHRKLNDQCGWVESVVSGDGTQGHHTFGVRMEGNNVLYTIGRRYLQRSLPSEKPVNYAGSDAALTQVANARSMQLVGPPPNGHPDAKDQLGYGADLPLSESPITDVEPLELPSEVVIDDFLTDQDGAGAGAGGSGASGVRRFISGAGGSKKSSGKKAKGGKKADDFDRGFLSTAPAVSQHELEARLECTVGNSKGTSRSEQRTGASSNAITTIQTPSSAEAAVNSNKFTPSKSKLAISDILHPVPPPPPRQPRGTPSKSKSTPAKPADNIGSEHRSFLGSTAVRAVSAAELEDRLGATSV